MTIEDSLNFRRIDERTTTSGTVALDALNELKANGYEVVINLMPDDGPYAVPGEADVVTGQGLAYHYIPVDFAAPTHEDFEAFAAAMDESQGRAVHVHCAANYRVSAFYSLWAQRTGRWTEAQADEFLAGIWGDDADAERTQYPAWPPFIAAERARLTLS